MKNGAKANRGKNRVDAIAIKTKRFIDETGDLTKEKLKKAVDKAQTGIHRHWKTAAVLLGLGVLARLFMSKRKS